MDANRAATHWRDVWEEAWTARAADPILALYADDAVLQSHPFRARQSPREYIEPTLAEEASAACQFGDPIVDGERAAVEWHAETVLRDGTTERLAGVSLLRFDADGKVVEQRDFWTYG